MYKHLLSICCFSKICPTMQCKHRRNLIGKKERHSLVHGEGWSATARTPVERQKQTKALGYLWTMSETDDKKLSILLENISAPFLKKLIWKIPRKRTLKVLLALADKWQIVGVWTALPLWLVLLAGDQTHGQNSCVAFLGTSHFCNSPPFHTQISCWLLTGMLPEYCWMTQIREQVASLTLALSRAEARGVRSCRVQCHHIKGNGTQIIH